MNENTPPPVPRSVLAKRAGFLLAGLALGTLLLSLPLLSNENEGEGEAVKTAAVREDGLAKATFAGGCFWCMEPPFDELDGVASTISGYAGGKEVDPTYQQVSSGRTGHAEVVQVAYDPSKVSYEKLLEVFWRNIDPTVENRQFCDRGSQYRTAIYFHDQDQESAAKASRAEIESSGRFDRIYTEIEPLDAFYPAEDYHQDFYKKKPDHYYRYRKGCGRDQRLEQLWGD